MYLVINASWLDKFSMSDKKGQNLALNCMAEQLAVLIYFILKGYKQKSQNKYAEPFR